MKPLNFNTQLRQTNGSMSDLGNVAARIGVLAQVASSTKDGYQLLKKLNDAAFRFDETQSEVHTITVKAGQKVANVLMIGGKSVVSNGAFVDTKVTSVTIADETQTIPESVTSLEGYGRSADTICNYVDFENKKYHKVVGNVDLGTLTWKVWQGVFYAKVEDGSQHSASYPAAITCNYKYTDKVSTSMEDKTFSFRSSSSSYDRSIYIRDDSLKDKTAAEFKELMSGVYFNYELNTEVVTEVEVDFNPVAVNTGDAITFNSEEGTEVPNKIEFLTI